MSTPYEDHLYQRIDALLEKNEQLRHQHELDRAVILFLARRIIKLVRQRDKARDLAVTLEQERALFQVKLEADGSKFYKAIVEVDAG